MLLKDLSKSARPSIGHYTDKYVRSHFGVSSSPFSDNDVEGVILHLNNLYANRRNEVDYYEEIYQAFQDEDFVEDIRKSTFALLLDRPDAARVAYYESLLPPLKPNMRVGNTPIKKAKLEESIAREEARRS